MPQTAKAQNLHPKMLPLQNFQDASSSKSSKPTSQNIAFLKLPTVAKNKKEQSSKSSKPTSQDVTFVFTSKMSQIAKAQNHYPKMMPFKSSKMPKTTKALNHHPKMLPFQTFQDASSSKSATPTSQNGAFPNLPRCLKQQKLKIYIPKWCLSKPSKMPQAAIAQNLHPRMSPFQIFQDASNSKSSKPTSQNDAFSNLPRCLKQQKLKTYIPK